MDKVELVVLGVGSEIRGDDGAGPLLIRELRKDPTPNTMLIDGGTTPESFFGRIGDRNPETLIIVDAADMNLRAGEIRRIPKERITSEVFTTHSMPLSFFWDVLQKTARNIIFIGIQPYTTSIGDDMSEPIITAVKGLVKIINKKMWKEIPIL